MAQYIQCPHCKYLLPFINGRAMFGELPLLPKQFVILHSRPRSACRNVEPVLLAKAEAEAQYK